MQNVAIIGSGDLAQQIAYHATNGNHFNVVGFFDDYKKENELVNQIPVMGKVEDVLTLFEKGLFDSLFIGIGYKHMNFRAELYDRYKDKIPFAKLIHSSSYVDSSALIEEGVVIYPGCIIDHNVRIKANTLLNVGCCIAHDSEIGTHSFLSPRVSVAGFVKVEDKCILGINSTIIDNIHLVSNVQVGGGGVVIKSLQKSGLYVGNPVRFIP